VRSTLQLHDAEALPADDRSTVAQIIDADYPLRASKQEVQPLEDSEVTSTSIPIAESLIRIVIVSACVRCGWRVIARRCCRNA
jgi:hypothetical protein